MKKIIKSPFGLAVRGPEALRPEWELMVERQIIFTLFIAILIIGSIPAFAALSDTSATETDINNQSPAITATVSDGGSSSSAPTNTGSNVTFTATAKDVNANQYYLAICKTNAVTAGNDTAPTCASVPNTWAISSVTNSDSQATTTYTVQTGDAQSNAWYAFVCDKVASTAACYPASGSGDQGLALGIITFSGVPVDGATLSINSITYEFDTANNGVTGGNTEIDSSNFQVGADAATALVTAEIGATSHMLSRSNVAYVYADGSGVGGNSIGMAEAGDTGDAIALSGTNLAGGSDTNASPFYTNSIGTFGTVFVSPSDTSPAQLLVDGDMEADNTTAWTSDQGAVISKQTSSPHGGLRNLRVYSTGGYHPNAIQYVLTIGNTYRVTGWGRSDGTIAPSLWNGPSGTALWTGTTSTSWQYFDVTFTAIIDELRLYTVTESSGFYTEWDDIMIAEVGKIEPGDTLKFTLPENQLADDNNINMYICTPATTSFNYTTNSCTDGSLICSDSGVDPAAEDAVCTGGADLVTVPTAHGSYGFKVYVEDVWNSVSGGINSQNYDVTDVAPTLSSYTATDVPDPAAGGSDTVDFSAALLDSNGDNDVTAVEGIFFDDTAINLVAGVCTADEKNCYIHTTCTLADKSTPGTGKTATGTDAALTANCSVIIWFNANASANWEVHVNPTDGLGKLTSLADSNVNLENPELAGIDIVQDSIAYGVLVLGGVSEKKETNIGNMGNLVIDIMVEGNTMCTDYPTCSGNTIAIGQQKWNHTDIDYRWNINPEAAGPYTLVDTASGTDDETGCLNRDITVRTVHDNTTTNESIWWKIQIPNTQALGTYTGENTFATTASTTCSTAQSY